MSGDAGHSRPAAGTRAARLLLALYPEPWRERYEPEMRALTEDDPPGPRGLATLVLGAARAHLRPVGSWREQARPETLMRTSVGALFACWILISYAGVGFAKVAEDLVPLEQPHALLLLARAAIVAGAALGSCAVAVGGLPLVWQAARRALRSRDRALGALILSPLAALVVLDLTALVLFGIEPARREGFPAGVVLVTLAPMTLALAACMAVFAIAPKAVMRRSRPPAVLLRRACWAGQVLTVAILLVAGGLALYVPTLFVVMPAAAAEATGPFGAGTGATLCLSLAAAILATGLALLAAGRARRAVRS
jgi:hypothetical protein